MYFLQESKNELRSEIIRKINKRNAKPIPVPIGKPFVTINNEDCVFKVCVFKEIDHRCDTDFCLDPNCVYYTYYFTLEVQKTNKVFYNSPRFELNNIDFYINDIFMIVNIGNDNYKVVSNSI